MNLLSVWLHRVSPPVNPDGQTIIRVIIFICIGGRILAVNI